MLTRRFILGAGIASLVSRSANAEQINIPTTGPGTNGSDIPLVVEIGFDGCDACDRWHRFVEPEWQMTAQYSKVKFHAVSADRPSEVPYPNKWRERDRPYAWVYQAFKAEFKKWTTHDMENVGFVQDNTAPRFIVMYHGEIVAVGVGGGGLGWTYQIIPKLTELVGE